MKKILGLCVLIVLAMSIAACTRTSGYDLVILNGRVMDPETEFDAVRNVGVKDGKIAVITEKKISGKETIDAAGLVVAPGFIDTHFHALDGLSIRLCALDGVTTGMDLEMGSTNVDKWYAAMKDAWPLNYGTSASQEGARMMVLDPGFDYSKPLDAPGLFAKRDEIAKKGVSGWNVTRSNLEQMNQINSLLDEWLREGALGVASTIGYARTGISTYEMFEAQRTAARYGRLTAAHTRFHGNPTTPMEAPLGYDELMLNGVVLNAPVINQHDNDYGWWEVEEKARALREEGYNVWSEYYPYDAAATGIGSEFLRPESFIKAMNLQYEKDMYDPAQDKYLTQEEYEQIVKEDPARVVIIFNPPRQKWLPYWVRMPHMTVAADSMWSGLSGEEAWNAPYTAYKGHPRTAGTRGKVLKMAREAGVPLMFTLSQLSYWSAKHLGDAGIEAMKVRGRMQEGMVADITIFDPEKVTDKAAYKIGEQGLPTDGIPYVIVNGKMVVKNSEFQKGVWAGQPIRYPVEEKGRFVPATVEHWIEANAIYVSDCPADPDSPYHKH